MIPICILAINDESDREFMTELFLQYNRLMYQEIFKITEDVSATEDVMQSSLVRLIDKIEQLRSLDKTRLVNYLISTAKNNACNFVNKKKPMFSFDELRDMSEAPDDIAAAEDKIDMLYEIEKLSAIWPRLDEKSRYLLEGRYLLDRSTEEMARDLNIKPDSLRMALTRARKKAQKLMLAEMVKRN